jgi:serine/threonine protein phosphatase PrpC
MLKATKMIRAGGNELQDRAEYFRYGSDLIVVVADGAGGMSGGAEAAEFVVQQVRKAIESASLKVEELREFLISIDQQMAAAGHFGETTCVIVALSTGRITGASVGDSGAWIISRTGIEDLTAHQCRKPFVGSGRAIPVGFDRRGLDGTLLVASDGLLKYTSPERIAATALSSDFEQAAKDLIKLVQYPSGAFPDDISVVLVRGE